MTLFSKDRRYISCAVEVDRNVILYTIKSIGLVKSCVDFSTKLSAVFVFFLQGAIHKRRPQSCVGGLSSADICGQGGGKGESILFDFVWTSFMDGPQ